MKKSRSEPVADPVWTTPESLVEAAYKLISFGPGGGPAWNQFRQLFAERSVLALRILPDDMAVTIMSLDEYVAKQIWSDALAGGYEETPIDRKFTVTRDMAEARVRFQMRFGSGEVYEAIDIFQMVRVDKRWWIVSIVSDCLESRPATKRRS